MAEFERLKTEIEHANGLDDADALIMQDLEREQRQLIRLIRRKQQAIQEQLQVLGDAQKRLYRMQDMSQATQNRQL